MSRYKTTTRDCKTILIHRLVWEEEKGKIPEGMIIHHKNGNKKDNRIENLQLVNRSEHRNIHKNSNSTSQNP